MARKTRQVEVRMLNEYLLLIYPKFRAIIDVPLGTVSESLQAQVGYQKALGITRPYRPAADAIVILPRYLLLIEAKVWNVVNGLAKLPLYKSLVPVTPELAPYKDREVLMELVVGQTNRNLEIMAQSMGVTIKLYKPPWLQEVVDGMNKYWTADYRRQREDKLAMRRTLGLE